MRLLIVEDEVVIANHIQDVLINAGFKWVKIAYNTGMAKDWLKKEVDLVLLDLRVDDDTTGLKLAEYIKETKPETQFIFITANVDATNLQKVISLEPSSYLAKPFKEIELLAAVHLALAKKTKEDETDVIHVKDGYKNIRLQTTEIQYIEADGNYAKVVTETKRLLVRYSLDWFMKQLNSKLFMRAHRKCIINLAHIEESSLKEVVIDGNRLPISRTYQSVVKEALAEYTQIDV